VAAASRTDIQIVETTCCIAGGGPAGMMLGLLLARQGVAVTVLEKHADFLRDFRGYTIHPSTLQVMHELGLLYKLLKLPHQKAQRLRGQIGGATVTIADFTHLPVACPAIVLMPQWDFLSFLAEEARRYPSFHLEMNARADELVERDGTVTGLRASLPDGAVEYRAALTVAADGRHSDIRRAAGLKVIESGAPMDVLWFRLSRKPTDPDDTMGRFDPGRVFVMIDRGDYWQCAYVIPKGHDAEVRAAGLPAFHQAVAQSMPFAADRVAEIADWDRVKLLTVAVDHLEQWCKPGLLCIGDSAHAMSPIGGVGINLAVQDAIASANMLGTKLRRNEVSLADLKAVQRRRAWPARLTQKLQVAVQNRIIAPTLSSDAPIRTPGLVRLFDRFPVLRRLPARLVGMGFRPEHVRPS
jgi:2-polyprenyl-6-methoxyphenol hydroxylase-like FAD-dependent oxidoreductase